jgi:hypothetical protein
MKGFESNNYIYFTNDFCGYNGLIQVKIIGFNVLGIIIESKKTKKINNNIFVKNFFYLFAYDNWNNRKTLWLYVSKKWHYYPAIICETIKQFFYYIF